MCIRDRVNVLSPTQKGIETFSSNINRFKEDLNLNSSFLEVASIEFISILTCFNSIKSLENIALSLFHFLPLISILSVKKNHYSILLGVFKTLSFFISFKISIFLISEVLKLENKSSKRLSVLINPFTSSKSVSYTHLTLPTKA